MTCGRSRTRIAGMSRESFPELPEMPEPIAEIPVKTLASMISRTAFAISMEESRFTLNGALLLMRPEGLTMVATDGHRLAFVQSTPEESGSVNQNFRALVPKKAMAEMLKLADDGGAGRRRRSPATKITCSSRSATGCCITRKLTGNFPDYERVLPKDHSLTAKLQKDEIRQRHRARGAVCGRAFARDPRAVQ